MKKSRLTKAKSAAAKLSVVKAVIRDLAPTQVGDVAGGARIFCASRSD
jgi:hypothetical protein